ncbi:MAG: hypothetical protein Q8P30_03370 [Candidatus Uhrbacteria bacterium]|nr:hypothetical protein [Candidatus Uhrbacteria bacterium]
MRNLSIKSSKYVALPGQNSPLVSSILHNLPHDGGSIFGLIRILGRVDASRKQIAEVIHHHLTRFQETVSEDVNIPRRFEQILKAINEDIEKLIAELPKLPFTDFHAVIGIIHQGQVFVSGTGNLSALFLHRTAKQRYVIYELDAQFHNPEEQSWNKPFVTVLDGELHPGDVFYVATRVPARELDLGELQDILVTLPPSGALKRVQQHLQTTTPYGAICFQVVNPESDTNLIKTNPLTSIEHLGKTQEETSSILGEQSPDFKSFINKLTSPIVKKLSKPGTKGAKSIFRRILQAIVKTIAIIAVALYASIKKLFVVFSKSTGIISKWRKTRSEQSESGPSLKVKIKAKIESLKNLPATAKYGILAAIIIIALLVSSVMFIQSRKAQQQDEQAFNTIVSRIEEKMDAAEASLIYDDIQQSRTLLSEAIALLESLPSDGKSFESETERLREELNSVSMKIRGITDVSTTVLADLQTIAPEQKWTSVIDVGGVIYGVTADLAIYRFNELEQALVLEDITYGSLGSAVLGAEANQGFLIVDNEHNLGRTTLSSATLNPIVSGIGDLSSIEDLLTYNDNLYVLNAKGQQVIKMRPQGDGYEAGTPWITARSSEITDARAIAIDGEIYMITSNGVVKFSSGREQPIQINEIDPSLSNPIDIWTELDHDYLYILEPSQSRVVVLKKDGSFVTQYVSDDISDGMQLIVKTDKNLIIVATPTKLISFTATHLLQ